jgi:putative flippase GtrA
MLKRQSVEIGLLIRFVAVGIANSAFGYGIYAIHVYVGLIPEIALLVATVLGIIFNFFTTGRLVFKNNDNRLFFRFVAVYAIIYICNAVALRILINSNVDPLLAQAALVPLSVIATFVIMRAFVFREARK